MNKFKKKHQVRTNTCISEKPALIHSNWNTICIVLILLTAALHIHNLFGWLNGGTLTSLYGINSILADAIVACPDILFYTTYVSLGVSALLLLLSIYVIYQALFDAHAPSEKLNLILVTAIIDIWAFPLIHIILDLSATAANIRDTMGFDVFQLGINATPSCVITIVAFVFIWLNNKIELY